MKLILFIVLILAVLAIVFFSVFLKRKKPDEYWNWWISFISTVVSLILGIGVGIYLFEYSQNRTNFEEKERITASLQGELTGIYHTLSTGKKFNITDDNNQKIEALLINLDQIIVNDAIRSNLFTKDETKELILISRNIKMLDCHVENLWAFLRVAPMFNTDYRMGVAKTSVENIDKFENNIKKSIKKLEVLSGRNFTKNEIYRDRE